MTRTRSENRQDTWSKAKRLAAETPANRNRFIDLLRALSICVVVFGHWLMAAPAYRDGTLSMDHMLGVAPWTQWLTWLFQVMPIFFMVGGYANAASWESAQRKKLTYDLWIGSRLRRLVGPLAALLILWLLIAPGAYLLGVNARLIEVASQMAFVPTWFLAVYIMVVVLAPATLMAWKRFGLGSFMLFAGGALLIDALAFAAGMTALRWLNYPFIWLAVHQLGYYWRSERAMAAPTALAWSLAGLGILIVLITLADYPVSMITVPGSEVSNSRPPTIAMVALALFQFGLMRSLEKPARDWLRGETVWAVVILVNGLIMTLYLWHMTVIVLFIGLLNLLGGFGLGMEPGSPIWWVSRPLWIVILALGLTLFINLFSRLERDTRRTGAKPPPTWRSVGAAALVCFGLSVLAMHGINLESLNITLGSLVTAGLGIRLLLGSGGEKAG